MLCKRVLRGASDLHQWLIVLFCDLSVVEVQRAPSMASASDFWLPWLEVPLIPLLKIEILPVHWKRAWSNWPARLGGGNALLRPLRAAMRGSLCRPLAARPHSFRSSIDDQSSLVSTSCDQVCRITLFKSGQANQPDAVITPLIQRTGCDE